MAMSTGKVVALIQAMGCGADPAVIKAAVQDWLDAHPEATTTVQDGSITEQKLATSIAQKLGLISSLSDEIDTIKENWESDIGTNLIDASAVTAGAIQSNGAVATKGTWGWYYTSDFIPLDENNRYCFSIFAADGTTVNTNTRYIYLLFDDSKTAIIDSYQNVSSPGNSLTIDSGSTYKYIRVSWSNNLKAQLEIGTTATIPYTPYSMMIYWDKLLGENAITQIEEKIGTPVRKEAINLHDTSSDAIGLLYDNGTINSSVTSYTTSDYIKLIAGNSYYFTTLRKLAVYDTTKSFVSFAENASGHEYVYTATDTCYIRYSFLASAVSTVSEYFSGVYTQKIEETVDLSNNQKETVKALSDALYNKKWAVLGDSFTDGATATLIQGGKYDRMRYVYPYLIGNKTGMNILKFFDGGRTLAFPEVPGDFTNSVTCPTADCYYQNIPEDTDYITIYLGINDGHHSPGSSGGDGEDNTGVIPIGTLDDQTTATFGGAWNVVLTWLLTNRPNAHIGIIVSNGLDAEAYMTMTINAAKKYGLPYLNLNGDERCRAMIRSQSPNIPTAVKNIINQAQAVVPGSNTHPNDAAHLLESTFIENFLRSI